MFEVSAHVKYYRVTHDIKGHLIGGFVVLQDGCMGLIIAMWAKDRNRVYSDILAALANAKITHAFFYCTKAHYRLLRAHPQAHLIARVYKEQHFGREMMRIELDLS